MDMPVNKAGKNEPSGSVDNPGLAALIDGRFRANRGYLRRGS